MSTATMISRLAQRLLSLPAAHDRHVDVERDVAVPVGHDIVLLADLYHPTGPGPHPTILVRSPYGRRGALGLLLGRIFAERGYRVMVQSCRGTFGSGGGFEPNVNERADGLATIRWLETQPWFDGRLAMNGPSYLGAVQSAVADSAGPSLRAVCTHVTYTNISRHWFRSGSFALDDAIGWTTQVTEQGRGWPARLTGLLRPRLRRIDRAINVLPVGGLDERVMGRRAAVLARPRRPPLERRPVLGARRPFGAPGCRHRTGPGGRRLVRPLPAPAAHRPCHPRRCRPHRPARDRPVDAHRRPRVQRARSTSRCAGSTGTSAASPPTSPPRRPSAST